MRWSFSCVRRSRPKPSMQASQAAARTVEITEEQYSEGAVDFTPVYLFQTTLTEQQDELAVAQGDIALGLIDVYRALGGGWEIRLENCSPAPSLFQPPMVEEIAGPADERGRHSIRIVFASACNPAGIPRLS